MKRADKKEIARRLLAGEDEATIADALGVSLSEVFRIAAELDQYLEPSTRPTA